MLVLSFIVEKIMSMHIITPIRVSGRGNNSNRFNNHLSSIRENGSQFGGSSYCASNYGSDAQSSISNFSHISMTKDGNSINRFNSKNTSTNNGNSPNIDNCDTRSVAMSMCSSATSKFSVVGNKETPVCFTLYFLFILCSF